MIAPLLAQLPGVPPGGDPLSRLRDVIPAPLPPWWPPAPGWWLLAVVGAGSALGLSTWLWLRRRRRRYRRAALAEIEQAYRRCQAKIAENPANRPAADSRYLQEANQILRRAALVAWPRGRVAALSGGGWLEFLDQSGGGEAFQRGAGQALGEGPYRAVPDCDIPAVHALGRRWLRTHRRAAIAN